MRLNRFNLLRITRQLYPSLASVRVSGSGPSRLPFLQDACYPIIIAGPGEPGSDYYYYHHNR
ncbi:hypothetical protein ACFL5V_08560 [Fibrobacterota bacterium]